MIGKIEKGERSPNLIVCLRVADALGLNLHDVLKDVPAKKGGRRK
jgi:DNA-binding XRE family transcriptional regulator